MLGEGIKLTELVDFKATQSKFPDTGRHFGSNPTLAFSAINQLIIVEQPSFVQSAGFGRTGVYTSLVVDDVLVLVRLPCAD